MDISKYVEPPIQREIEYNFSATIIHRDFNPSAKKLKSFENCTGLKWAELAPIGYCSDCDAEESKYLSSIERNAE